MAEPFTCPICGRTSYNPTDVEQGYCGDCHDWTRVDIVLEPHPHKLVCPNCGMVRNLPEGWQAMLGSETLTCVPCNAVMVER